MNDIVINWKKILRGLPSERHNADDRIPTFEEICRLLEHPDRRIKTIVLTMISSGIRVGSWDYLQWKHVIPIERNGITPATKLIIKNTKIKNRTNLVFTKSILAGRRNLSFFYRFRLFQMSLTWL
jgi:hypothetical protein